MQNTLARNVPIVSCGIHFAYRWHIDLEVFEQVLLPTNKDPPNVFRRTPAGLAPAFVESNGDVAHTMIGPVGRSTGRTDTLK